MLSDAVRIQAAIKAAKAEVQVMNYKPVAFDSEMARVGLSWPYLIHAPKRRYFDFLDDDGGNSALCAMMYGPTPWASNEWRV